MTDLAPEGTNMEALIKSEEFLGKIEVGKIESQEHYAQAADLLQKVKKVKKVLDKEEKAQTAPLVKQAKAIRDDYRQPKARCDELEAEIKAELLAFRQAHQEKRKELAAAPVTRENMNALAKHTPAEAEGLSFTEVIDHEITDLEVLPPDFRTISPRKREINAALRADPDLVIPGVKRVVKRGVRART